MGSAWHWCFVFWGIKEQGNCTGQPVFTAPAVSWIREWASRVHLACLWSLPPGVYESPYPRWEGICDCHQATRNKVWVQLAGFTELPNQLNWSVPKTNEILSGFQFSVEAELSWEKVGEGPWDPRAELKPWCHHSPRGMLRQSCFLYTASQHLDCSLLGPSTLTQSDQPPQPLLRGN